jgi:hypothetical protein
VEVQLIAHLLLNRVPERDEIASGKLRQGDWCIDTLHQVTPGEPVVQYCSKDSTSQVSIVEAPLSGTSVRRTPIQDNTLQTHIGHFPSVYIQDTSKLRRDRLVEQEGLITQGDPCKHSLLAELLDQPHEDLVDPQTCTVPVHLNDGFGLYENLLFEYFKIQVEKSSLNNW